MNKSPSTTSFLLVVGSDWSSKAERFFLIECMGSPVGLGWGSATGLSLVVVECLQFSFFLPHRPRLHALWTENFVYKEKFCLSSKRRVTRSLKKEASVIGSNPNKGFFLFGMPLR